MNPEGLSVAKSHKHNNHRCWYANYYFAYAYFIVKGIEYYLHNRQFP
jgi:hypothetical protein